jgi:hypothetical protein
VCSDPLISFRIAKFLQGFIPRLKQHLLPRVQAQVAEANGWEMYNNLEESSGDWQGIVLKHDRFYSHNIMRVNYTTYDVQQGEDMIHAWTLHCDIMMLKSAFAENPSQHPFCYAQVHGIFHANVIYLRGKNQDPVDVLWGCHTIPTFSRGKVHPNGKLFSNLAQDQNDWFVYYINWCIAPIEFVPALSSCRLRFVDHDMVLHYHWGHGVGHTYAFGAD